MSPMLSNVSVKSSTSASDFLTPCATCSGFNCLKTRPVNCINRVKLPILRRITSKSHRGTFTPVVKQVIWITYLISPDLALSKIALRFFVLVSSVTMPHVPAGRHSATCSQCFLLAQVIRTPFLSLAISCTCSMICCVMVLSLVSLRPMAASSF